MIDRVTRPEWYRWRACFWVWSRLRCGSRPPPRPRRCWWDPWMSTSRAAECCRSRRPNLRKMNFQNRQRTSPRRGAWVQTCDRCLTRAKLFIFMWEHSKWDSGGLQQASQHHSMNKFYIDACVNFSVSHGTLSVVCDVWETKYLMMTHCLMTLTA